jgi:nucleoid DNA-binding protein
MEDTIIALLNNNLRVIIPDFGAFIIRQKQPRIIVFNEFLRYNDGILIDFIVKTEGIDREIAEQRVADFAEDGTKLLASGRQLTIEGLGSLRKDSSGKISFIEAPEIIEIENKGSAEPERIPEVAEEKEIPIIVEQKTAEEKEIPKAVEPVIQDKPKSKTTVRTRSKTAKAPAKVKSARLAKPLPKSVSADIPMKVTESSIVETEPAIEATQVGPETAIESPPVAPVSAIEAVPVEPEVVIEASTPLTQEAVDAAVAELKSSIEPAAMDSRQSFKPVPPTASMPLQSDELDENSYRTRPSVSTNRILAWVLIILFVNAGILAWFVFRNKTKGTPAGKSATTMISDTLYNRLADSVRAAALDSSIVYNDVPDEGGDLKENALTPGSRYYIVAGCFRDEINADSLVSSLKLLGYKAEKFGKIGNLFAVCFASFDNKDAAVSELKKIREKVPSAWMTKF